MHVKVQNRGGRRYLALVESYRDGGRVRTRTVESLGYEDELAAQWTDPLAHFRAEAARRTDALRCAAEPVRFAFPRDEAIAATGAPVMRQGAAIALGCLDAIGVRAHFARHEPRSATGRIFEMLAAERMMHATSKRETWAERASFPRRCDFSLEDVYDALPAIARAADGLAAAILRATCREPGPRSCIYVVLGSYAFPRTGAQPHGMTRGLAVALDGGGMPLGYRTCAGAWTCENVAEAVAALSDRLHARRAVVIAGSLPQAGPAKTLLARAGNGFVTLEAATKSDELRAWLDEEAGWRGAGAGGTQVKDRLSACVEDGLAVPVRDVALRGQGYATAAGRMCVTTSETALPPARIVQWFREVWRQAEPFQVLEADFAPLPRPIAPADHADAHFAICYAAFCALRELRRHVGWEFNAATCADALLRLEGVHVQRNYYLFSQRSAASDAIQERLGLPVARRLLTAGELRRIPAAVRRSLTAGA